MAKGGLEPTSKNITTVVQTMRNPCLSFESFLPFVNRTMNFIYIHRMSHFNRSYLNNTLYIFLFEM